ncbi:hypothetical protein [Stenotrophomonas maltophilia]|uniref:hypothetical protein n=1 Tax=Stenotrophomonas maltophilia TaxID=40324 RepID=UPI0034DB1F24
MKRMFRLSVAIGAAALVFGLNAVAAEPTPCDECYRGYQICLSQGKSEIWCYGALSRCLQNSTGCNPPN